MICGKWTFLCLKTLYPNVYVSVAEEYIHKNTITNSSNTKRLLVCFLARFAHSTGRK